MLEVHRSIINIKFVLQLQLLEWNGEALIQSLVALKQQNPDLKITTALGGWSFGVERFSALVASQSNIEVYSYFNQSS